MKGIMQNLANQYRLVYSLQGPDDGKLHQIKVDAFQVVNDRRHEFKVRVRKGWRFSEPDAGCIVPWKRGDPGALSSIKLN